MVYVSRKGEDRFTEVRGSGCTLTLARCSRITDHPKVRVRGIATSGLPTIRELLHLTDTSAFVGTNLTGELITSGLPVIRPQWATANRERQGALTESRTTIAGDPFYREWLCGVGQGCRGRILERLYIDNCLPLTVKLFRQLAFFILSCKPISYCGFKRIDVYIL